MKKLRLDAGALAVESFAAIEVPAANGFFATRPQVCDPVTVAPHCG
jgi:hypothetical protein